MNKTKALGITNLIGILLIIVAIISAGGLCYVALEYTQISETLVTVDAAVTDIAILHDYASGEYQVIITIAVSNPSRLNINIYSIEYLAYADRTTTTLMGSEANIGGGSTSTGNGTVVAGSVREIQVFYLIGQSGLYLQRLQHALDGGNTAWIYLGGFLLYRISDFQDVSSEIGLGYLDQVVIQDA
jgi:hypothetical protein